MTANDPLQWLLTEFFQIPTHTAPDELCQKAIEKWDSLAMMQMITELQLTFQVEFDLEDIERLTSYAEIRSALVRKGAKL